MSSLHFVIPFATFFPLGGGGGSTGFSIGAPRGQCPMAVMPVLIVRFFLMVGLMENGNLVAWV